VGEVLSRLSWALFAVAVVLVATDVVVSIQAVSLASETAVAEHGFPFVHGASIGCALMGALIISRYERHPIGWLLSGVGISTAVSLLAEAYAYWVLESDGPGSRAAGGVAAWVAQLFGGQITVAVLALMFMLAPDGHFLSPRWRLAALVPGIGAFLCFVAIVTVDPLAFELYTADERWGPIRQALLGIGFLLITIGLVLAALSMVFRLRRSTGEDRQRLRPVVLAAALAAAGLVVLITVQSLNGGQQTWVAGVPLFLGFFLMPILFAVAVLRYRLYDLDVIINRTVLVAVGTAFAALGYTALVVLAGQQVEGRAGGFWVSLLATVVVALAFQPLRRVVIRLANRAAYGERAQPYEALTDFSRRLAAAPDPDDLLPAVAEAAARAVSGRGAQATLDVPGGRVVSGTWGWWGADHEEAPDQVVPVESGGRTLGRIAVALPRGRSLRPADERLLEALADQTAVAFRNTSLAGTLADRVAELDRTTRQLAQSRLRLIAADDAARRALEAAITRRVLPFLEVLPQRIDEARDSVARGEGAESVDGLVDGTNEALEALRELTRGVFPAQLARAGLETTLGSLLGRAPVETRLAVSANGAERHPARVEAAVYFCCAEVVAAATARLDVELGGEDDLTLRITGRHGALDLAGITDRVAAVGGELEVTDQVVELRVPVPQQVASPVG
jgi:uncharacterized membrane protein YidH (DUF202 family)